MRIIIMGLLIIVTYVLQTTLCPAIALASISPNLILVFIASFGFMRGKKSGLLLGFFCGLLLDVFYSDFLGYYALIYMSIGYFNGMFNHLFFDNDIKLPMVLAGVSDLMFGVIIYFFSFLLYGKFHFFFYLSRFIIPEMLYTLAMTLFLYRIYHKVNDSLERYEKRSVEKHVS